VETLIHIQPRWTHEYVGGQSQALGIKDGLVRISAGLEEIDELKDYDHPGARTRVTNIIDVILHADRKLLELCAASARGSRHLLRDRLAETGLVVTQFGRRLRCCSRRARLSDGRPADGRWQPGLLFSGGFTGNAATTRLAGSVGPRVLQRARQQEL